MSSRSAVGFPGSDFFRLALVGVGWLAPLCAHAEERDPAEIGHALVVLGLISSLFLFSMTLSIWLLVVRLRQRGTEKLPQTARQPNFEPIWFPNSVQAPPQEAPAPTTTERS